VTAPPASAPPLLDAAVFASGGGSNFQALIDHVGVTGDRPPRWRPSLLVSDRPQAGALERARRAGIPSMVIPVAQRDPDDVAAEILAVVEEAGIRFLLLAGYLRLVPPAVVRTFGGRILNVHPALLPAFGGRGMYGHRIHQAVLEAGACVTGVTVHLVDEVYDRGRILAQWPVPVLPGDDPELLAARVLAVEHLLYPRVVDHLARALSAGRRVEPLAPGGTVYVPAGAAGGDPRSSADLLRHALDRAPSPSFDPSLPNSQDP
jgi:phosphoribosylglycinamide formyltransferase 1